MNIFKLIDRAILLSNEFFAYLRLREAVRKADEADRKTGKRHYVLPSFGGDRKLIVIDRSNFRIIKRKGYIDNKALVRDMILESFYFTPHRDGSGWITDEDRRKKIRQYFSWFAAETKAAKERKKKEKKNGKIQCKK